MCVHMNGVQEYLQAIAGCTSVFAKRLFFSTRTACLCKVLFFFKVNGSSPLPGLPAYAVAMSFVIYGLRCWFFCFIEKATPLSPAPSHRSRDEGEKSTDT